MQLLQGSEFPVDAVATTAHDPTDEGGGHTSTEDRSYELSARAESFVSDGGQCMRESDGLKPGAMGECPHAYRLSGSAREVMPSQNWKAVSLTLVRRWLFRECKGFETDTICEY